MYRFEVAVVFVLVAGFFQTGSGETTCESHRKVPGGNSWIKWNITCDAQGNYHPSLQCTNVLKTFYVQLCACYNKEDAVSQPSRILKTCECPLKRYEAMKNDPTNVCAIPKCAPSGQFKKKRCCTKTQKCHCVDPITGQKTSEPTSNRKLRCQ